MGIVRLLFCSQLGSTPSLQSEECQASSAASSCSSLVRHCWMTHVVSNPRLLSYSNQYQVCDSIHLLLGSIENVKSSIGFLSPALLAPLNVCYITHNDRSAS